MIRPTCSTRPRTSTWRCWGATVETLLDATLRVLWIRARGARSELRPVYLQMSQPHVLAALPVDEQLRLARRLVATREDAAALRVLDGLLASDTLKNLYGRQIADCLLGLFTTYSRHGLRQPAEDVKRRLSTHFPSPATLGGIAADARAADDDPRRDRNTSPAHRLIGSAVGYGARPRYSTADALGSGVNLRLVAARRGSALRR